MSKAGDWERREAFQAESNGLMKVVHRAEWGQSETFIPHKLIHNKELVWGSEHY